VLRGELDGSTGPLVLAALAEVDGHAVVVDLTDVTFADSGGLHVLLRARREHAELQIVNPRDALLRVMKLIEIDRILLDSPERP
jgi:anti-anti-sigma factor